VRRLVLESRSFAGIYCEHSGRAQDKFGIEGGDEIQALESAKLLFAETSLFENLAKGPVGSVPGCIAT
jgi:hypothetical protein